MSIDATPNPATAIPGYDYGSETLHSPVDLHELARLKAAVGMTEEDERYLRMAGAVLADQAGDMVDEWRAHLGAHPHLAAYSKRRDGSPNPEYAAATRPRFVQWVIDACLRGYDQQWLDYQHEIGLRHMRERKNLTDHADSPDHVPMRYLVAFSAVVIVTARTRLAAAGRPDSEVQRMHDAWTKAVMLAVTLWTRPYVSATDW